MRLLEMSGPEIEDAVRNELDENPALENVSENASQNEAVDPEGGEYYTETSDQMQAADYGNEDDTPAYLLHAGRYSGDDSQSTSWMEQHGRQESPVESLNRQLDMIDGSPRDVAIARYLIGNLDDNGRLSRSLKDIANDISISTGTDVNREDLLPGLDIIRYQLDPPGLGAVDLRECLLIQLRRKQPKTLAVRAAQEIIEDYFDLFAKKHLDKLQTSLGVDRATLDEAISIIRSLDPKPGTAVDDAESDKAGHITPDFYVTPVDDEDNTFTVSLNQHVPELAVEESFKVDRGNKEGQMFIRRKREEANSFIGLIKRRSETLLTVMKAIVALQRDFFHSEDAATLKPMRLNDLSDVTGLDKSIISRATANKYVATPSAVYPLKYFFNDRPIDDSETSSPEILEALQEIIDAENKVKPLSDRALADELTRHGYNLARRTVTKYREKLNIPVARLRKEY